MEERVILKFNDKAYTRMYHSFAFPMGIIQGNADNEKILPWICGKFINCKYIDEAYNNYNYELSDTWAIDDGIIILQRMVIVPGFFEQIGVSPLDFFRKMIELGNYIYGLYNEEHDPTKEYYHKQYHKHDFLLIGYDDTKNSFIAVDFDQNGSFGRYYFPYDDFIKSIKTLGKPRYIYDFLKYNNEYNYNLNVEKVANEIKNYLNSVDLNDDKNIVIYYGIEALKHLISTSFCRYVDKKAVDVRYTRGLMEQKFFWPLRLKCLKEFGYKIDENCIISAQNVYEISEKIHMLGIKYNITFNEEIIARMKELGRKIIEVEEEYLPKVLNFLKQKDEIV